MIKNYIYSLSNFEKEINSVLSLQHTTLHDCVPRQMDNKTRAHWRLYSSQSFFLYALGITVWQLVTSIRESVRNVRWWNKLTLLDFLTFIFITMFLWFEPRATNIKLCQFSFSEIYRRLFVDCSCKGLWT